MSDQYQMTEEEQGNAKADSIAAVLIIITVVATVAFWLLGH
jgi:hypothetical protein